MQPNAPVPFGPAPQLPNNPYLQPRRSGHAGLVFGLLFTITLILLMAVGAFAAWAYTSRQDYKNNVDKKIAAAVKVQDQKTSSAKDVEFAQKEKSPLKQYKSPATYGAISIMYPKTWSAYVVETDTATLPVDGYFHPGFVPNTVTGLNNFALRVQVSNTKYATEMSQLDNFVKGGQLKISPYTAPKVPGVSGVFAQGTIANGKNGLMVMFPLRDKTIKIFTESTQYSDDFKNFVLANLTFEP